MSTKNSPKNKRPANSTSENGATVEFPIESAKLARLEKLAAREGVSVEELINSIVRSSLDRWEAAAPNAQPAAAPDRAKELLDIALRAETWSCELQSTQPGVRLCAPGLFRHLSFTESQALHFMCEVLSSWSRELMQMSLSRWPEFRQNIAHCLLIIEAVGYKAGFDWIVEGVKESGPATDTQIFVAICDHVRDFEELERVFAARNAMIEARSAERAADMKETETRVLDGLARIGVSQVGLVRELATMEKMLGSSHPLKASLADFTSSLERLRASCSQARADIISAPLAAKEGVAA